MSVLSPPLASEPARPAPDEADTGVGAPPAPSSGPLDDRRARRLILAALLVGLGIRLAIGLTDDAPSVDETAYLRSGLSWVEGDGYERDGHAELHFPPLVPALLGIASRVVDNPHTGTVVLTVVAGTALMAVLVRLAHLLAGRRAAVATAWVAALAPGLATTPAARGAGSEAEYALLLSGAVLLVVSSLERAGPARLVRVAGAGGLVGLAYLTRPEGLLVAVPLGLATVLTLRAQPRRAARAAAAFALPVLLCVAPYASFLRTHTGQWQLTAKTQDVSLEAWHAVAHSDRHSRDAELYALDETGLHLPSERTPLTTLARDDPAGYAGIVVLNVRGLGKNLSGWWLLPLPVWGLAAHTAWRRGRRQPRILLLVSTALVPVATTLVFFVQPRYLVVTAAMAVVLVGVTLPTLADRWRRPVTAGLMLALAGSALGAFYGAGGWWHPGDHTDQQRVGEWIADHTEPGDRVMTRSMVAAYYADRPTMAIPYGDYDEILHYARHYGAQYLVIDWYTAQRLRPQIAHLEHEDEAPGLRLVHEEEAEGRTTRVFALDPAPPPPEPGEEEAPSLGFVGDAG